MNQVLPGLPRADRSAIFPVTGLARNRKTSNYLVTRVYEFVQAGRDLGRMHDKYAEKD